MREGLPAGVGTPWVQVDGTSSDTVLLAHAPCGRADEWAALVARLLPTWRVLRIAYAGLTRESRAQWTPERYRTLHGHADDVVRVLDRLDARRVTIVGHGLGGLVGILARLIAPERIAALVLVGTPPATVSKVGAADGLLTSVEAAAFLDEHGTLRPSPRGTMFDFCRRERGRDARTSDDMAPRTALERDIAATTVRAMLAADVRHLLPRVRCPVAVLHGLWDPVVPASAAQALARGLPMAKLAMLPTHSAMVHVDHPEIVEAATEQLARGD